MKRILAILLALLTVVSMVPAMAVSAEEAEPVATAEGGIAPLAALPSSFYLRDDPNDNGSLPPIDDQGQIGSCVGQSVTYMQFSNAVARYMQSKGNKDWKPNDGSKYGNDKYIFSPKWTLNYSGAGTVWVYDILVHMGGANQTLSKFYKGARGSDPDNASLYYHYVGGKFTLYTETSSWDVTGDIMQQALNIRLKDFDQIWTREVGGGQVTTTDAGKAFIDRIKASVLAGNVVVTGGPSGLWGYASQTKTIGKLTGSGDIGKAGEYCCFAAQGTGAGGHQVSIVGWDDNVTYTVNGVTLKGAFLVANSWHTSWMNDGYLWFMYDSINLRSEFAAQCPALADSTRTYSLDQFVFTDWQNDIIVGNPDLTITAEVTTKDRESTSLYLTRTDKVTGVTASYQPVIFKYGDLGYHENYDVVAPDYLNYAGEVNGEAATANFTFSYEDLYTNMPAGKTVDDYVWGFRIQVKSGNSATVGNVKLQDKNLKVLFEKNYGITVNATDAIAQAFISCSNESYIIPDSSTYYAITPYGNSASPVPAGGSYSFTVEAAPGFTTKYATVMANGKALYPVNGVYTINDIQTSVVISVAGIVENVSNASFSPTMYNGDGWEYYGNKYVMVVSSTIRRDLYANTAQIGTADYPYYFRLTDQATGISYTMQPASIYDFQNGTVLYRLPYLEAGMTVVNGETYTFTVDVLFKGNVLYTGKMTTKVNYDASDNKGPQNQDAGATIKPSGDVHTVSYYLNGKLAGKDAFVKGSEIVPRGFITSASNYNVKYTPDLPETMGDNDITVTPYAEYALGDINGDGIFNVKDITRLCMYLENSKVSCDKDLADADRDGKLQISDVTYLISKMTEKVTLK